jgi:EpsI family protein
MPMKINPIQAIAASIMILAAAVFAQVLTPHELMAKTSAALDLEKAIPQKFGTWTVLPGVGLVTPSDPDGYVEPDVNSGRVYSQEVGRAYADPEGHVVMLMVAYGPVQNYRLKAHRPEICYTAAGFRVSEKFGSAVAYGGAQSLNVTRLVTQRESRYEPLSYWMRIGNDVSNGIIDRQWIRLKYGLQGLVPDGALIRVSTVGVDRDLSFKLQDKFIRDFLTAVDPSDRKFFVGT